MQSERPMMRFLRWLFRRRPVPKPVIYRSFVANEISSTWLVRCLADPKKARAMIRARYWLPSNRAPALWAKRQQYHRELEQSIAVRCIAGPACCAGAERVYAKAEPR